MVQTRSKARAVGGTIEFTGLTTNSLGLASKRRAPGAATPAATAATTTTTAAANRTPIRKPAPATRRRGKAKPATPTAPTAGAPSADPLPAATSVMANTADASTQVDATCDKCEALRRRVGRRDAKIRDLRDENEQLRRELERELLCHEAANAEITRLGGVVVDRKSPEDERYALLEDPS